MTTKPDKPSTPKQAKRRVRRIVYTVQVELDPTDVDLFVAKEADAASLGTIINRKESLPTVDAEPGGGEG